MHPDQAAGTAASTVADGVLVVDSELGGQPEKNGVFLLTGDRPVLVESGVGLAGPRIADALTALGVGPRDLAGIVLTHVHLDHAGGAGLLARRFPAATVLVHPAGARHLVDPARLLASARQAHGPLMDTVYGTMTPVPADRVRAVVDGERIELGGQRLAITHTPGHAPHHLAVLVERSGVLFTGDAAGVRVPGMRVARPATPPPSFDREAAAASLRRMAALRPDRLVLTHFGPVTDPAVFLADAEDRLRRWCAVAERVVASGADDPGLVAGLEAELMREFAAEEGMPVEDPARFRSAGGYAGNAAGLLRWARNRGAAPDPTAGSPADRRN